MSNAIAPPPVDEKKEETTTTIKTTLDKLLHQLHQLPPERLPKVQTFMDFGSLGIDGVNECASLTDKSRPEEKKRDT